MRLNNNEAKQLILLLKKVSNSFRFTTEHQDWSGEDYEAIDVKLDGIKSTLFSFSVREWDKKYNPIEFDWNGYIEEVEKRDKVKQCSSCDKYLAYYLESYEKLYSITCKECYEKEQKLELLDEIINTTESNMDLFEANKLYTLQVKLRKLITGEEDEK